MTTRRALRGRALYTLVGGAAALGSALTYWMDPDRGRRRRALMRDRAVHGARVARESVRFTGRDLVHRLRGMTGAMRSRPDRPGSDDDRLHARVRSELGRVCSHPRAIDVSVEGGVVTLRGPVLEDEKDEMVRCIACVRGVQDVRDELEMHPEAGSIPALQGGSGQRKHRSEFWQTNWSPAARFVAMGAGAALLAGGTRRGPVPRLLSGIGGGLLLARAATNLELRRLLGVGAGCRAVDVQKQIQIRAPMEEVFAFWSQLENFPRFMTHVKNVQRVGPRRYRWEVDGPGRVRVTWEADVTELIPNQLLAWRTVPGSLVQSSGTVRFDPHEQGGTRLHVRMQYNPPGGAGGHAFAKLLGADPKRQMDDDLLRFKSLIETGRATGRSEQVTREDLEGVEPESARRDPERRERIPSRL